MNINLLPDKFIKNRAMDVILIVTGFIAIMMVLLFVFIFLFFQLRVTSLNGDVNNRQMKKITLEKQVEALKKSQQIELQDFLTQLKMEQRVAVPVITTFNQVADKTKVTILSYELNLLGAEEVIAGSELSDSFVAEDGSDLLPSINVQVQGDFFQGLSVFKEAIEQIDWVYDCKPISVIKEGENSAGDFVIRLRTADIPKVARMEGESND